ncbi:MAG: AEC family transporter [Lachnospiraceae bacterium]|nr:AEC family transporter [Lachnospiraceae bacterium]
MSDMIVLQITIFGTMAVGLLVRRLNIVSANARSDITNLVLNVILPCNIVTSFLTSISPDIIRDCITVLVISVAIQIGSLFYGTLLSRGESEDRAKNLRYAIICSNAGFLGNPVAEGVFGAFGLMLASIYLIPQRIMMWSEGLAIYSGSNDVKGTVKRVLTHPCVIACMIGIVLMVTGYVPPDFIMTPVRTIGRCNTAMSMMVIGMILAEINIKDIADKAVIRYTVHRLVIIPLIIYIILRLLPVSHMVRGLSVLLAAMPAGATTSMLASKYDRDPQFAVKLVVFSTICSIPAIIIWSAILR